LAADITFYRALPDAHAPMPADKAALGFIPVSAFQYCEAMRVASGMGWYMFPPRTLSLMFDGRETFIADEGQWRVFTHEALDAPFQDHWNAHAPERLHGHAPSYVRRFSEPGIIQIWTGYFVETAPDLWLHIRPLVNVGNVSAFTCYEAIVETDSFRPAALFMNLRIHRTDSEILIPKEMPLFQVCAIEKSSVLRQRATTLSLQDLTAETAGGFWSGMENTLRIPGVTQPRPNVGTYAAAVRKRNRPES
jgi:hypothetical protein